MIPKRIIMKAIIIGAGVVGASLNEEFGGDWFRSQEISSGPIPRKISKSSAGVSGACSTGAMMLNRSTGMSTASSTSISMLHDLSMRGSDSPRRANIETRYVLEDVPYGLIPTLCLAGLRSLTMPLHKARARLSRAYYSGDLKIEDEIPPLLGPLEFERLKVVVEHGFWPA
jgi:hypothetical protein